jgi:S-adenosylmethionine hydrolase
VKKALVPPIVLLTDFGLGDPFVGLMKGVLIERAPASPVIDLTHGVPPQDVRIAAFDLYQALEYFPEGTLFVCVVDPGVGSDRAVLWARNRRHQFLAPDNGLLSWVAAREPFLEVRKVVNRKLFLKKVSNTFHGRDVFAPVAAALATGTPPAKLGAKVRNWFRIPFPSARHSSRGMRGEILALDRFGNAITNMRPEALRKGVKLRVRGTDIGPIRKSYASVASGRALAVVGSSGFVELSVRDGNFSRDFGVKEGETVDGH